MTADEILDFCFPEGLADNLQSHRAFWEWLMRGGADDDIRRRFRDLPDQIRSGAFGEWAATPKGRLASILVLDQFPRSIFRDTAKAYAFDPMALDLAEQGLACGHFSMLAHPWERTMFALPLVHAEGHTLRTRASMNVRLARETLAMASDELRPAYQFCLDQSRRHKEVIDRFGRHPHRNKILGRSPAVGENSYLAGGNFPHQRAINLIGSTTGPST